MITSDVVIVGGGIIGASIAFHLAGRGVDVVVCDAGAASSGATVHSAAQVRMHHSDIFDARLAAMSHHAFESWADVVGGECGFRRAGFAFLAAADRRDTVAEAAHVLNGFNVETVVMAPDAYVAEHPGLLMDGVGIVAYEPRSGYADPVLATRTLLARAADHGARVLRDCTVVDLIRHGDRLVGLHTSDEACTAAQVVVAAGAHSKALCATAGIDIPTRTKRIGFGVTERFPPDTTVAPNVVIDDTIGMYFRPHADGRVLFGVPLDEWDTKPADPGHRDDHRPDRELVATAQRRASTRFPAMAGLRISSARSALEAYTPDRHALIGVVAGFTGAYVATGFSGGGFKVAPAVGAAVADELVSGSPRAELEPYRLDRFQRGAAITPTFTYDHM